MSRNQKIFLTILSLYVVFDFVLGSLVGLFLWDKTKSANNILIYYITLFGSIMVSSQFASAMIAKFSAKKVYILSIVVGVLQALLLFIFQNDIAQLIIIIGIVAGTGIGLQAISYNLVASDVTDKNDSAKFIGIKSSLMNIVSIISVPVITYIISKSGSYNLSYFIGIIFGLIVIVLISKLEISPSSNSYNPSAYFMQAWINPDSRIYLLTRFMYGLFGGPIWAILGVTTLRFAGSLSLWGVISTIFTVLHIAGSYLYGRLKSINLRKAYSTFSSVLFGSFALLLATNWNFTTFLLYQFGLVILNTTFAIHYESLTYDLISENSDIANHKKELLGIGEIFIGIGRIIPLIILLFSQFTFEADIFLQILFIAISTCPLIIINLLKNSTSFQGKYAIL